MVSLVNPAWESNREGGGSAGEMWPKELPHGWEDASLRDFLIGCMTSSYVCKFKDVSAIEQQIASTGYC